MFQAARQQLERLPRRQAQTSTSNAASGTAAAPTASAAAVVSASSASSNGELGSNTPTAPVNLQFLLSRFVLEYYCNSNLIMLSTLIFNAN